MKYFLLAAVVFLVAVLIVAVVNRKRREAEKVRHSDHVRLRERCRLAETTLHEVQVEAARWSDVDHVMAGGINPILTKYATAKYELTKENLT